MKDIKHRRQTMENNAESKQSPILGYRIPEEISKEERDALNKKIKDIAKSRKMNYFELFSQWVANDHLLNVEQDIEQIIIPNITQEILDRLEKLEKTNLELSATDSVKQTIEYFVKQKGTGFRSVSRMKEELVAKVKEYHSQGKNAEEIARILTEEGIPTLTGRSVWSSSTIRDWLKECV